MSATVKVDSKHQKRVCIQFVFLKNDILDNLDIKKKHRTINLILLLRKLLHILVDKNSSKNI